jgi:hypothetical protein
MDKQFPDDFDPYEDHSVTHDAIKVAADGLSIGTVVATLFGWLPQIAALASLVWTAIRIYETKTVQRWLGREP